MGDIQLLMRLLSQTSPHGLGYPQNQQLKPLEGSASFKGLPDGIFPVPSAAGAQLRPRVYFGAGTWDPLCPLPCWEVEEEEEEAEIVWLKAEHWQNSLAPSEMSCAEEKKEKKNPKAPKEC